MTAAERVGLLEDEAIVVDEAALELSGLDHPDTDIMPYAARIAAITSRVISIAGNCTSAVDRARALARVIAVEEGLIGDQADFENPANADLISVLDRRRGLPVALAILYVGVARRIGWRVDALNMPGHILTRLGREPSAAVQDPFNSGAILGEEAIAFRFGLGRVGGEFPAPLSNRSILLRLLNNPAARALQAGDRDRALVLYERMTALAPSFAALWWERARLELRLERTEKARASLAALLETTRDRALRGKAFAALSTMARPEG
jgi:regulator of sirC expression with transglutaminase-like and TPR domain